MARRPQLEAFAREHGLKIGTIADLIHYRLENELQVECVSVRNVETEYGPFTLHAYRDHIEHRIHLALTLGDIDPNIPTLVRVHVQNPLSDVLGMRREDFGLPLNVAIKEVAQAGSGLVLVLGGNEDDDSLLRKLDEQAEPSVLRSGDNRRSQELRTYGIGAQIIHDLGVCKMRVLSAPKKLTGLSGFGLEVVEYVEPTRKQDES